MKTIRNIVLFVVAYVIWCQISPGNFVQDFATLREYAPDLDGEKLLNLTKLMIRRY